MSLTALLKDSFGKEFRERLLKDFPTPKFEMGSSIFATPEEGVDYQISGTAYDYMLRFAIERITPKDKIIERGWVAERGFNALLEKLKKTKASAIKAYGGSTVYNVKETRLFLREQFEQAKKDYKKYMSVKGHTRNAMIDFDMIRSSVFLAKLDLYVRRGIVHPRLFEDDNDIVSDVSLMYSWTDIKLFKVKNKCFLNPFMGQGCFVGGCDADLIIDDTLIDIKTTRKDKLQRIDFNQLIGYYVLSLISGINRDPKLKPIKKVGIYFARFRVLWIIPLKDIGDKKKFEDIKNYLFNYPPYLQMMKDIDARSEELRLTLNLKENE